MSANIVSVPDWLIIQRICGPQVALCQQSGVSIRQMPSMEANSRILELWQQLVASSLLPSFCSALPTVAAVCSHLPTWISRWSFLSWWNGRWKAVDGFSEHVSELILFFLFCYFTDLLGSVVIHSRNQGCKTYAMDLDWAHRGTRMSWRPACEPSTPTGRNGRGE